MSAAARPAWRRPLSAVLGVGAAVLAVAPVPMLAGSASAATTVTVSLACDIPVFSSAAFTWDATVTATAVGDGTDVALTVAFSDMPGVSPAALSSSSMTGEVDVTIDGAPVTLTGGAAVTAAANAPVPVPPVTGTVASTATSLDVALTHVEYTVLGSIPIVCDPTASGALGAVAVDSGAVPTATPTTSPTASTSATATATPSPTATASTTAADDAKRAVPAKGVVSFACVLNPLGSDFDYEPTIAVYGSRESADDDEVALWAEMSDMPGLAPVPIENNAMEVTLNAVVGGTKVALTASSMVNAAIKAKVAVPTLKASMTSDAEEMDVEITGYSFDFEPMSGLDIDAPCEVADGAALGTLTVGIGAVADDDTDDTDGTGTTTPTTTPAPPAAAASLPGTGAGTPLAAIGLWAGALGLLGAAVFLLLPPRRPA
ncbi:hypothetical protein E8D34_07135 [Nocardioides sp. GY 10113]|uniref:hypothetical protein n=1 Tax=Nocardioides sp. GY 10113 TaxID=2569761 RepID=UPI0010A80C34|nr:hypothetical protein [Nocardioides sp. GY 10113]TIC88055.1 hypothetical protein E8D34_07135 [Nocardioides sp. GY 10113]